MTFPLWFVVLTGAAVPFMLIWSFVIGARICRSKVLLRTEALLFVLETLRQAEVPLSHDAMVSAVRDLTEDLKISPNELAPLDELRRKTATQNKR